MSYARNLARLARDGVITLPNLTALRDMPVYSGLYPLVVETRSHTGTTGVGGGIFDYDPASTDPDDNGVTIMLNGHVGPGRYIKRIPNGVSFYDYGGIGQAGAEDTPAIEACLNRGGLIIGPDGDWRIDKQLIIKSSTTLRLNDNCVMRHAFSGAAGDPSSNCSIKNEHCLNYAQLRTDPSPTVTAWDTDISIIGGKWGHLNDDVDAYVGGHIALIGVRHGRLNTTYLTCKDNWCSSLWLEEYEIEKIVGRIADVNGGSQDVCHIIGGRNIEVGTVIGNADDDLLAIGSNFNIAIENVSVNEVIAQDTLKQPVRIYQWRFGSTAGLSPATQLIKNISIGRIVGSCGANGGGAFKTIMTPNTTQQLLKNISIGEINLEYLGTVSKPQVATLVLEGCQSITIGSCIITGTPVRNSTFTHCGSVNFGRFECPATTDFKAAIETHNVERLQIDSGDLAGNLKSTLDITDTVLVAGAVTVRGAPTNTPAVLVNGASSVNLRSGFTAIPAAGVTTARGIVINTGATVDMLTIESGVDFSQMGIGFQLLAPVARSQIDDYIGHPVVEQVTLTATQQIQPWDARSWSVDGGASDRNILPGGSIFPDGWHLNIYNAGATNDLTFQPAGTNVIIKPGERGEFIYDRATDKWVAI